MAAVVVVAAIDAWLLERCGEEVIPDAVVGPVMESDAEPPPAP